jgi:cobalt-zinc-cadmium efflux system outer membrane protein
VLQKILEQQEFLGSQFDVAGAIRHSVAFAVEYQRAESERIVAAAELRRAEAECDQARSALASLWGDVEPDFDSAAGALAIPDPPPDPEEVAARVDASPAVASSRAAVARQEAEWDAQRRETRPDLALLGGVRRLESSNDTVFVAAVGLPLPLFDRRRGAIAEASARRDEAEAAATAARLTRQASARRTRIEALVAAEDARVLRDVLLARSRTTYDLMLEGYRRGKFGWLDLLAARRDMVSAELRTIDALVAAQRATAELSALMGHDAAAPGAKEGR